MRRLVQPDVAAAGERNRGRDSPIRRLHLGAVHILRLQRRDETIEIVAHQIQDSTQQFMAGMTLRELSIRRVNRRFCGRHAENQPASADIDRRESKNIAKEGPIRLGISAVDQEMSADNHAAEYIRIECGAFDQFQPQYEIEQDVTLPQSFGAQRVLLFLVLFAGFLQTPNGRQVFLLMELRRPRPFRYRPDSKESLGSTFNGRGAKDAKGLAGYGRGFFPEESGRDSKVVPSLSIQLRSARGCSRLQV